MVFKAYSMLALAMLFRNISAESQSSSTCSDGVCASEVAGMAALGSAMLQKQSSTRKAAESTLQLDTEDVTCKCDNLGKPAPQNSFTCSNGDKSYCGSAQSCKTSDAFPRHNSDWSGICKDIPDKICGNASLLPGESLYSAHAELAMQTDGNLVIYARDGHRALWGTATESSPGSKVVMQDDCNVVVYDPDGKPVWDRMRAKKKVEQAKHWWQKLKHHATNIWNKAKEGDFKGVYNHGKNGYNSFKNNHLCKDHTSNDPNVCLVIQGDCNLVVYADGGKPLWDSGTRCR